MGKHAVLIIGPAGSGKSTLTKTIYEHYNIKNRPVNIINMDPAAEILLYNPIIDIRELININDVMESENLGPNGAMIYCMEYIINNNNNNNNNWLLNNISDYNDDFLLFDLPGQIEITSNIPIVPKLEEILINLGYKILILFVLDAVSSTSDGGKYISGCLMSLSSMVCFSSPFLNILMKVDLLSDDFKNNELEKFCTCDFDYLNLNYLPEKWKKLAKVLGNIINDFNLVSFQPVDINNIDYINNFCIMIDDLVQYSEDAEVNDVDINNNYDD